MQKFNRGVLKIREKLAAENQVFQYCNSGIISLPGLEDCPEMSSPESFHSKIFLYCTVLT